MYFPGTHINKKIKNQNPIKVESFINFHILEVTVEKSKTHRIESLTNNSSLDDIRNEQRRKDHEKNRVLQGTKEKG